MPNWRKVIVSGSDAILNSLEVDSTVKLHGAVNAGVDTDKFLVLDSSNNIDYRTGAEVLSDIGADAYGLWYAGIDKSNKTAGIKSGGILYISGSDGVTASIDLTGTPTIILKGTYAAGNGISLKEANTTFSVSAGTGLTQLSDGLEFDPDGGTLTTDPTHVDHILINDAGVFKRIAPSDIPLSNFNDDLTYGTMDNFTISDGTNTSPISDGNTLTITGSGDISVAENAGTVTISSTGATITGTDSHILYFNGDDNAEGNSGFTYSVSEVLVTVGEGNYPEVDVMTDSAAEGGGKHRLKHRRPLSTNAIYQVGRYNLVGLGRSQEGGGPGHGGLSSYFKLPGTTYFTGGNTTMAGDLQFGNMYAITEEDGNTTLYLTGLEALPGSPAISMRNGSIYFTPSESVDYDISGSKITPKSSASIALDLAPDSSSLSISVGRGDLTEVMFVSKSGREPRIGIGTNTPKTALDVIDRKDDGSGTKILLRSSRETEGGQVGDVAGTINFTIDSGSYKDIETSGSIASISAEVKSISKEGVYGYLKLNTARNATEPSRDLWQMGYGADETNLGTNSSVTSGSINIKRGGSNGGHLSLTDTTNNSTVGITTVTETISGADDDFLIFVTASDGVTYDGVIFDYTLKKPNTGVRVGQFMVAWDGSNIEFTDTSAPAIGDAHNIQLSATLGINNCVINAVDGDGFTFKAIMKKL